MSRRFQTKVVSHRKIILFSIFSFLEVALIILLVFVFRNTAARHIINYIEFGFRVLGIILSFHIVFSRKDKSEYRFLWLLLMVIEPILGSIFYVLFAEKIPYMVKSEMDYSNKILSDVVDIDSTLVDENILPVAKFLASYESQKVYSNSKIDIFIPCNDVFRTLLDDIRNAKKYVYLQTFIMSSGKFLKALLDEIEKNKSIEVYFFIDDFGSFSTLKAIDMLRMKKLGIKLIRYNKINLLFHSRSNYRNHRKNIIIDGKIAYVGGMNIADEYLNLKNRFGEWIDCVARIEGNFAQAIEKCFVNDWNRSAKEKLVYKEKECSDNFEINPIQFYTSHPSFNAQSTAENVITSLIYSAKKSIKIITPYLSLTNSVFNALKFAKLTGVDISIIIPGIADKKFVYIETLNAAERLSKNKINVNIYKSGFTHAKFIIIDDSCVNISSVNFDYRSFYLSNEAGVNIYSKSVCSTCNEIFEKLLTNCDIYTSKPKGVMRKVLEHSALILRSYF